MQRKELERVVVVTAFGDFVKEKVEQMNNHMKDSFSVMCLEEKQFKKDLCADMQHTLFFADSRETEDFLQQIHAYVVGYEHESNRGTPLVATEYVFSDLEDLSADDIFYVWNRVTGQPCEVLETEHLLVRETTIEDVDTFYEIYKDAQITRYMEPLFADPEEERAYQAMYIRNIYGLYGYGVWTVIEKKSGRIVGRVGVAPREGCQEPELGFIIGRKWQRRGYAYEVCKAILTYAKTEFSIDRVIAVVHQDNQPSIGLCEKLGFSMEDRVLQEYHVTFLKEL